MTATNPVVRDLQISCVAGCLALLGASYSLGRILNNSAALVWLLSAALLWAFVCYQVWQRRELNRADIDSAPYAQTGWANRLTLLRGALIAASGGFVLLAADTGMLAWIPALLYSVAAILDRVDGYVARRSRQTSLMGSELDTVFDALGLVVAPLLALLYGKVHWTYLLVSVAYYCFQAALLWRKKHALPVFPLQPNQLRRALAGFQMGFIAVVLWPGLQAQLTIIAGTAFMLPLLAGFSVDWLVVSGRIQPAVSPAAEFFHSLAKTSTHVLQPALRLFLVFAAFVFVRVFELHWLPAATASLPLLVLAWCVLCTGLLIAVGFAVRIAALCLLVVLASVYPANTADFSSTALVVCSVWILLLGSGRCSLWQGDDVWVNRHDGAR